MDAKQFNINGTSVLLKDEQARNRIAAVEGKLPSDASSSNKLITKTVDDLVNYYLKSETYTKSEVEALIGAIQHFHYEVYASTSAVTNPSANVLYLIGPSGTGTDKYEEYVYDATKQSPWIKIGDTSIDLSDYATISAMNTALAGKQDVIADLVTIRANAMSAYQKPSGGIPKSDLEQGVKDSLDLADTALQSSPVGQVSPSVDPYEYATRAELEELGQEVGEIDHEKGELIPVNATANGWKLLGDGLCASDSSARLVKYLVTAGTAIYVKLSADNPGVYQFQSAASVPASGTNANLIGSPVNVATNAFVKVPSGATYLIVSESTSNATNEVREATTYDFAAIGQNTDDIVRLKQDITVAKIIELPSTLLTGLRVDTVEGKITSISGEPLYYVKALAGQTIHGNWTFASGYVRFGITKKVPALGVAVFDGSSGGTGTTSKDYTFSENGYFVASFGNGAPTSISFTMDNNGIGANVAELEKGLTEAVGIVEKITGAGATAISKTYQLKENKRYHLHLDNFRRGTEAINYQAFVVRVGSSQRAIANYYGDALIPEDLYFYTEAGEDYVTVYIRQKSGEVVTLTFSEVTNPPIFDYNDYAEEILRIQNTGKRVSGSIDQFRMLYFSDVHADTTRLLRLLGYYDTLKYSLDEIIHTGDSVANKANATTFDYWDECGSQKVLNCIGNHDVWYEDGFTPGANFAYDTYFKPYIDGGYWGTIVQPAGAAANGLCYYYKDFSAKKIRLIVLDYQNPSGQITWLNSVLADAVTNALSVVIAIHYIPHPFTAGYETPFNISQYVVPTSLNTDVFVDAVDTFIGDGGDFVCWLTGHTHMDFAGYYQGTNGKQVIISIDCADLRNDSNTRYRVEQSKSQDAFNIFAVNTNAKLITMWRVGNDRDALQRKIGSICIDYSTGAMVYTD